MLTWSNVPVVCVCVVCVCSMCMCRLLLTCCEWGFSSQCVHVGDVWYNAGWYRDAIPCSFRCVGLNFVGECVCGSVSVLFTSWQCVSLVSVCLRSLLVWHQGCRHRVTTEHLLSCAWVLTQALLSTESRWTNTVSVACVYEVCVWYVYVYVYM